MNEPLKHRSFVRNINRVAENIEPVQHVGDLLTEDGISVLEEANRVDYRPFTRDLAKGATPSGYRKLDIPLYTNTLQEVRHVQYSGITIKGVRQLEEVTHNFGATYDLGVLVTELKAAVLAYNTHFGDTIPDIDGYTVKMVQESGEGSPFIIQIIDTEAQALTAIEIVQFHVASGFEEAAVNPTPYYKWFDSTSSVLNAPAAATIAQLSEQIAGEHRAEALRQANRAEAEADRATVEAEKARVSAVVAADEADKARLDAIKAKEQANLASLSALTAFEQAEVATRQANAAGISADAAYEQAGIATDKAAIVVAAEQVVTASKAVVVEKTDIAVASATQAKNSATQAADKATVATTQAGVATTKATAASDSASTATTQAGIATSKAEEASTAAGTATFQAGLAANSQTTATEAAQTAESKASIATDKANAAALSAQAAQAAVGAEVVQVSGISESDVMSQKGATEAFVAKADLSTDVTSLLACASVAEIKTLLGIV